MQDGSATTSAYLGKGEVFSALDVPLPDKIEMIQEMAKMDMWMGVHDLKFLPDREEPFKMRKKIMNNLMILGLMLVTAYIAGLLFEKAGLPRIIAYIITGVAFSPGTIYFVNEDFIGSTRPLMDICLAFIAFEVGGELKWSKIKAHEKEILSITILASLIPYILIAAGILVFGLLFPEILPFGSVNLILFVLLLGALAAPTAPAATLAVMQQYKAKGKVSDTILGVVALDDVLGILLFSLTISVIPQAAPLIIIFVLLRSLGKYLGVNAGARLVHADRSIRKYVAGGLIPQAGIAIGLVLSIYGTEGFEEISDMLLTTIMGATIINELAGPLLTKYSLKRSGEIIEPESTS